MSGFEWRGANDVRYLRARGRSERKLSRVFGASIGLLAIVGAYAISDAATLLRQTGVQTAEAHQARPATDTSGIARVPSCDTEAPDMAATGVASTDATGNDPKSWTNRGYSGRFPSFQGWVKPETPVRQGSASLNLTNKGGNNKRAAGSSPPLLAAIVAGDRSFAGNGRGVGPGDWPHHGDTAINRIDANGSDSASSIDVATILEGSTDIETGVAPDAGIVKASKAGGLGDVDSLWSFGDGANTSFSATDVVARPDADQDGGLLGIYLVLDAGRGGSSLSKDGQHDYRDRA
jgi:hypothetical protein